MAAFVLMMFLSGEKEKELRLRLEGERAFSESLAQEADWTTNMLAQAGGKEEDVGNDGILTDRKQEN